VLDKSLLIKALLSRDDENTVHDKKEIRTTDNIPEKRVNAYQEKAPIITNRVVSRNIPHIHNTAMENAVPQRQHILSFDLLSKFVIALTFTTAIVAALYFVAAYIYSNTGTHLNKAKNESEQHNENDSAEKKAVLNAEAEKAKAIQQTQNAVSAAAGPLTETTQALREREKNQNIELLHQADKERAARLQPAEPIAPRQLSTQQQAQLTEMLKYIPGQITFIVPRDDAEARNFAQTIAEALYNAGWTIQGVNEDLLVNIPAGLTVHSLISTPHTDLLQRSLRRIGFDVSWSMDQNVPAGAIVLLVGGKP
jgi:hypothetical protein